MLEKNYSDIRPLIKTGDCILWRGTKPLQLAIQIYGGFSHASLVVRPEEFKGLQDRVFIVEATGHGVDPRQLSLVCHEHGQPYLLTTPGMSDDQRKKLCEYAIDLATRGVKYNFEGVFKNVIARINTNMHRFFCSELVWVSWIIAGYIDTKSHEAKMPRPGDMPRWAPQPNELIKILMDA